VLSAARAGDPELAVGTAAVGCPTAEEVAVLAGAIRDGDLSTAQCERLARLVEQAGYAVRVASGLAARGRDPLWEPVAVVEWVAQEFRGLLELSAGGPG
jgi:hypothetical protein